MKKKFVVPIIVALVLIIGIVSFILFNNRITSTITLDVNPSIKFNLARNEKIKNVVALNDDAEKIIDINYKGKSLDDALELLVTALIDKGFIEEHNIDVIIHSKGHFSNKDIATKVEFSFGKKDIHTEIIVIDKITKEDEILAKEYNVSPAKMAYIKSILEENKNINIKDFVNKSVSEVKETKETGRYCEKDYKLEGDWCLKEKSTVAAKKGKVCPRGYLEYEEKCYEEVGSIESNNYTCREEFKLVNNKCIRKITNNAIPSKYSCTNGTSKTRAEAGLTSKDSGDANDIVCVDMSSATHPVSPCEANDRTEYTVVGGVCYWHRAPIIADGCPGKIQVGDSCWDNASEIYICPGKNDGMTYKSRNDYCKDSIKYNNPTVTEYKCEEGFQLEGDKCTKKEEEPAEQVRICPTGYRLVNRDKCIGTKDVQKEDGLVCNSLDERLRGNQCITYEQVEAKHN